MGEQTLLVIAGCNGAGKSSFSSSLAPISFSPFDYDKYYLNYYESLFDSDIRDVMAHNMAFAELEKQIAEAITKRTNFCYETNFNSTPLYWPDKFKRSGYKLELLYLCLDSIEEAKRRVAIRYTNGGHYVSDSEIEKRYFEGFANLNADYRNFDVVHIFDTSAYVQEPLHILTTQGGKIEIKEEIPKYLAKLIPDILAKR